MLASLCFDSRSAMFKAEKEGPGIFEVLRYMSVFEGGARRD